MPRGVAERVRNPEYFRQPVPGSMYVPEGVLSAAGAEALRLGGVCYSFDSCWRLSSKRWRPKTLQTDGAVCICCGPLMEPRPSLLSGSCLR